MPHGVRTYPPVPGGGWRSPIAVRPKPKRERQPVMDVTIPKEIRRTVCHLLFVARLWVFHHHDGSNNSNSSNTSNTGSTSFVSPHARFQGITFFFFFFVFVFFSTRLFLVARRSVGSVFDWIYRFSLSFLLSSLSCCNKNLLGCVAEIFQRRP